MWSVVENQKIAACGSSYKDVRLAFVGAAAGCDLFAVKC